MFIEGLSKKKREGLSNQFIPEEFEGKYVKVIESYKPDYKYGTDNTSYYKLSKFDNQSNNFGKYPTYYFSGFGIDKYRNIVFRIILHSYYDTYVQYQIVPITREEFINGCNSLLTTDLQNIINWNII